MIAFASILSLTTLTLAVTAPNATKTPAQLCVIPAGYNFAYGTPVELGPCFSPNNSGPISVGNGLAGTISFSGTNLCLDVKDGVNRDGTRLQVRGCTGGPNQQFQSIDPGHGYSSVKWKGTNQCLDIKDGVIASGTPIQIWTCHGGRSQLFALS